MRKSAYDIENILNSITDMITIHDRHFNILFANPAAENYLKLPTLNTSNVKCFKYFHGSTCPPKGCPSCNCLKTGKAVSFEMFEPYLNSYIEIRAIPRFNAKNEVNGIIHIVRDITERKRSEKKLKESRRNLRNLNAHLLLIAEREREAIAREIHDELSQSLAGMHMNLVLLEKKLPTSDRELHKSTKAVQTMLDDTIKSVQRISSELRPKLLDELGLYPAMKWHAGKFQERTGIKCLIESRIKRICLSKNCKTNIYRIFQEALTNVYRHAEATKVEVKLKKHDGNFLMKVSDNGKGITPEQIANSNSLGLIGMRERAHMLKGRIDIQGLQDQGTVISMCMPAEKRNDKAAYRR